VAHSLPLVNNIPGVYFAEVHHPFVAIYEIHGISISWMLGNQRKEKKKVELLVNASKQKEKLIYPPRKGKYSSSRP
jgi:hypothetical protein